ncbi:TPA: HAD family hydrolase [Bacillus cereus]|nr:HAD family hydrolase [Bacillus cereus]
MYSCVIFDVDGTIIDTEVAVLSSLQKLLQIEKGKTYSFEELAFVLGIPGEVALKHFNISDIKKANNEWNKYLREFEHHINIFPDLQDTLITLWKAGIKTGIVTSKTKQELIDDFYPFNLQNYLSYIVCADDTVKHKPHPEPLLKFLDISKCDPADAIYIGDTKYDSQCAKEANVSFGLALWGAKSSESVDAEFLLKSPKDILEIVKYPCEQ